MNSLKGNLNHEMMDNYFKLYSQVEMYTLIKLGPGLASLFKPGPHHLPCLPDTHHATPRKTHDQHYLEKLENQKKNRSVAQLFVGLRCGLTSNHTKHFKKLFVAQCLGAAYKPDIDFRLLT